MPISCDTNKNWTKEDYNNEPVFYCDRCLSLNIKDAGGIDYCDDCGGTKISTTNIGHWEDMCQERM